MNDRRGHHDGNNGLEADPTSQSGTTAAEDRNSEGDLLAYIRSAPDALGELEIDRSDPHRHRRADRL
jgi:hypothetical protein